jgi:hypothetical protein
MAYFLGSDVKVALTTESTNGVQVLEDGDNFYNLGVGATVVNGVNKLSAGNLGTSVALADVVGLDLGIGAMDEDVSYLGHRTPLKAEVHKETTVSLTLKRKNAVFDTIYTGDKDGAIGRWGCNASPGNLQDGLTEPTVEYGYRLAIYIKGGKEVFTVKNACMVGHTISLNADGTQEETIEFSSQVEPVILNAAYADATTELEL